MLRHVRFASPEVAIIEIRMPPTHTDEGLIAAQSIRRHHPDVGVLVLSQYVQPSPRDARLPPRLDLARSAAIWLASELEIALEED